MQTVQYTIKHLTGAGWRESTGVITVDETIGTRAGRDEYATARGTIKKLMRRMVFHPATRARLIVNQTRVINIWIDGKDFVND